MKVSELIEELKKYDGNLEVICSAEGGHVDVCIDWVSPLGENNKITKTLPYTKICLGEN